MTDKPYINKQNWGRELLDRLGNLLSEDGSINTWEVLPTTGQDGLPLSASPSHVGYSGIYKSAKGGASILRWDGTKWETILQVPVGIQGVLLDAPVVKKTAVSLAAIDPGVKFPHFYLAENDNAGNLVVSQYRKDSGELNWTSSRPLQSGFAYCSYPGNTILRHSCFESETQFFIGVQCFVSITNVSSVRNEIFAYDKLTGAFQWKALINTSINSPAIALNMIGGNLVCLTLFTKTITVIAASTGSVLSANDLGFPNVIDFAEISINTLDNRIIVRAIPQGTARLEVYTVNATATSLISSYSSVSSGVEATFTASTFVNPGESNKVYFFDYNSAGDRLISYNSSTNSTSVILSLSISKRELSPFIAISFLSPLWSFYNSGEGSFIGASIRKMLLNLTSLTLEKDPDGYFPSGEGNILPPRNLDLYQDDFKCLKVSATTLGYGAASSITLTITISSLNQQITSFLDAVITAFSATATIKTDNTLSNVSCKSLDSSSSVSAKTVSVPNSDGAATSPANSPVPNPAFLVGSWGRLFCTSNNPGLHSESASYGGGGKVYTTGFLANAEMIAGRFVNINGSAGGSAIVLYDQQLEKLFIQSSAAQPRDVIANFPGGGTYTAITVNSLNNVGIKTDFPAYPLDVVGGARATTFYNSGGVVTSDTRMKLGMTALDGELLWDLFGMITPISFFYRPDFEVTKKELQKDENGNEIIVERKEQWELPQKIQFGYKAQEIREVLPELITVDESTGILYLAAAHIPVLFQAAATTKINNLQAEVDQLKAQLSNVITRLETLENAN